MSAQKFLNNQVEMMRRALFGADYPTGPSGREITKDGQSKLKRTVRSDGAGGAFRGNNTKYHIPIQTPEVPKALNPNASAASRARTPATKPNPFAATPTGKLTGSTGPSPRGGILTGLAGVAANQLVGPIVKEATAGARVIAGDPYAHLPPSIKSINGTNYDISTESGRKGYDQAKSSQVSKKPAEKFNNTAEINASLEQQKKEKAAALAKTKGDYDHSSGGYTGEREIFTPEDTRKNGLDIVQKGRNLGRRSFGDLLNAVAPVPYSSNQLPLTDSSPFTTPIKQSAPIDGEYPDFGGEAALRYDSETGRAAASARDLTDIPASMRTNGGLSERKDAGYTSISPEDPIYAEAFGQEKADLDKKRGQMSNRLSDALSGVQDQEANREITPERRQQMASMAFLNTKGSMAGLKARDRVNNVVYAAGQHYGEGINPNDGDIGDKFKIDRKDARGIADGSFSAQELLGRYTKDISETSKDTPAQNQAPLTEAGNAVRDQFAPAKQSDFELNNGDMGDTKPGQKTIDSNFMESANFSDPVQLEEWKRRMNMLR